jgi:hypothetical protein
MTLSKHLFRLGGNAEGQTLLALVCCLTEVQKVDRDALGVRSDELWRFIDSHRGKSAIHPSVDHDWRRHGQLQATLRRLRASGLARGTVEASDPSSANVWRVTTRGYAYLGERVLFEPARAA